MRGEDKPEFYGPWGVLTCHRCRHQSIHQCSDIRDRRTWLRIVLGNWWQYGWRYECRDGSCHPVGYGVSWHSSNSLTIIMHPMPMNVVMRTAYELVMWMHRGGWRRFPSVQDRIDAEVARRMNIERQRDEADNPLLYCPDCNADLGRFYSNRLRMVR